MVITMSNFDGTKMFWKKVPASHNVALTVMDRVSKKLEKDNLMDDYVKVFKQQEEEGIIERIEVDPQK